MISCPRIIPASHRKTRFVRSRARARRSTTLENFDGRSSGLSPAVEHRFRGIRNDESSRVREKEGERKRKRKRLFALDNNGRRKPPLMRLRDLKLGTAQRIQTFLLILIPLLLLCSLSPLFPSQVNNSSSFTYPTPEFIMEIILFVSSLVLVLLGKVQARRR